MLDLNASRRSRVGVGMNRSAGGGGGGGSVKRFERSNGLDIAVYKKQTLNCFKIFQKSADKLGMSGAL